MPPLEMIDASAKFSTDELYRYELTRLWDSSLPRVCFIMLNPSTADAATDDPTIRRCIGFAKDWRFGSLVVVNLFALRTRDPKRLRAAADPVGPENAEHISAALGGARLTVCAWGVHGHGTGQDAAVLSILPDAQCLGATKAGAPRHPLYVKRSARPTRFPVNSAGA